MQWVVSVVLAVTHVLTALGFTGVLARPPVRREPSRSRDAADRGRRVRGSSALAELLSGAIGGEDLDSTAAGWVGALFGISSLMTALGGLVAGIGHRPGAAVDRPRCAGWCSPPAW